MGTNHDYVVFGTPLEPLEEDEVPKKRPAPDLTVRDEKGRQRFHGAFTGGFSAGYFNSVGTKEGWAPSSFKSSRKKKADELQQRNPEDFMDEEDLGVFGIAPRRVQTTKDFRDESVSNKRPFPSFTEGPIPGEAPLKNLIQPVSESVGNKLLKKMGWKPGQGIGPRVKKKTTASTSLTDDAGVFGCALPPTDCEEEHDIYAEGYTFAPKDVAALPYTPKNNFFGIGYSGLIPHQVLKIEPPTTVTAVHKGKKLSIRGQAFGVGALEDDDEDIYARDDMTQYDFALDDPEFDQRERKKKVEAKVQHVQKALEGFHLAKQLLPAKKHFPAPELPKHFRPIHRPPPGFHVADIEPPSQEHNRFLDRHSLTTVERGVALEGGYKGSVFDLISESDRKRLTAIKLGHDISPEKPEPIVVQEEPVIHHPKSKLILLGSMANKPSDGNEQEKDSQVNFANHLSNVSKDFQLTTFKPFVKDNAKQERYEQFLVLAKSGDKEKLETLQPRTMTEWEKQKEMEEFYRAALLFKPLAASLGSRFTTATHQESDDPFMEITVDKEIIRDDQQKAADMKMFGHLTRSSFEWHPDKLLCRRFNIPNPYPDSSAVGLPTAKRDKVSIFNFLTTEDELKSRGNLPVKESQPEKELKQTQEVEKMETETSVENREADVEEKKDEATEEEPEKERPPMDLFRAIFQDTDSEDNNQSSESDDEQIVEAIRARTPPLQLQPKEGVRKPNTGKGVFANLDLDALCRRPTGPIPVPSNSQKQKPEAKKLPDSPAAIYGPALPPSVATAATSQASANGSDMKSKKLKKHKHKKHKHKSKKSKHKGKHSNKYGTKDRPDSDDSSDSSVSNMDIIQKMVEIYRKKL